MANNLFVTLIWQLFLVSVIYPVLHFSISTVREFVPRVGRDERLFPRDLLSQDSLLNQHRIKKADDVLKSLQGNFSNTVPNSKVEIRIVASNRGNAFLYQTVVFLAEQQFSGQYKIGICNVESDVFPDLKKFDVLQLPITTVGEKLENYDHALNNTIKKENEDYWKCLGIPNDSRYILLMEDDSVVIPEFSRLLKSLVSTLDSHESIDFVKLYHPNYLRKLPSWVLMIAFSIVISFAICSFFRTFPFLTFLIVSFLVSWDLTSYGAPFPADVRFYMTGSAYISYPESCCTPAVIFRNSSLPKMLKYFRQSSAFNGHAKDHILDESPFTGRQSDINYVTHIGSFSSVRQRSVVLTYRR